MRLTRLAGAGAMALALAAPAHADDALLAAGRALFTKGTQPPCAVCHTLKDAGTSGQVGPVLDELQPDANRVATALRNGVGNMPSFKTSLSEEQIDTLARYIATVTR